MVSIANMSGFNEAMHFLKDFEVGFLQQRAHLVEFFALKKPPNSCYGVLGA
jgi:hypothetical protein